MHFNLVKITPKDSHYTGALDDVILSTYFALKKLNFDVTITLNESNNHSCNILFGSCSNIDLSNRISKKNTYLFNFEQLHNNSHWNNQKYIDHLRNFNTIEYSQKNFNYLTQNHSFRNISHIKFGYVEKMTCISDTVKKDIDVLFYGAINERRLNVISDLKDKKINIFATNNAYSSARDSLIARSKIVLNLHYYTPGTLEVARLGYLWANKKAIVSEKNNDTEFYPELANACAFANINNITEKIIELLNNPEKIKKNETKGYNSYKSIDYSNELKKIFGSRSYSVAPIKSIPHKLNIGSGKEFLSECINIDINEICKPDIILDISKPITFPLIKKSKRFGDVNFTENQFEYIKAYDVLEHIPDLTQAMTNILKLLKTGGLLDINVPYDLSYGAWQDPTHVRTFNEHSWKYYTQWAWYIGWRDYRLDLIKIEYVYSDLGKSLINKIKKEIIHIIPRAIDSMIVKFIKRESTNEEIIEHDTIREQHYIDRNNNWNILNIIKKGNNYEKY